MRKILGLKNKYKSQVETAQVELFKDYFHNGKMIECGPVSAAMGFDIAGWPIDVFTSGEQPGDSILMMVHNPDNLKKIKERRNINYDAFPPNEVPQVYDIVGELLYGKYKACKFEWGLSFEIIKKNINKNICMMISGPFPAGSHYVLAVGYDDEKKVIIYNDPYPPQWPDKNGYNREMDMEFLSKMGNYRIDFYPKRSV
jgi:hypothetical protein